MVRRLMTRGRRRDRSEQAVGVGPRL